jgi:hypothetical protein
MVILFCNGRHKVHIAFNLTKEDKPLFKRSRFFSGCLVIGLLTLFSSQEVMAKIIWQNGAMTVEDEMAEEREGRIEIGKLRVIPALKVGGVYEDNIFLGNGYTNNPNNHGTTVNGKLIKPLQSDYIMHVMPGILLDYGLPGARGNVSLGYQGDWAFYREITSHNWNNQRAVLNADYTAPGGLLLGVRNVYNNGNDPYGDATQYELGFTRKRWNNDLNATIGWDFFNRFKVMGYYDLYKQKYADDIDYTQNWTTNKFGIGFQMRVLPKTWAFLRYYYQQQNFDTDLFGTTSQNNASNKQNSISGGLRWDTGAKLGGELNFGWAWLSFDNARDRYGRKYEGNSTWIAATSIRYQMLARTRLTFDVARAMRPTGSDRREYYDDTAVGINIGQDLPYKFSMTAGFIYSRNDYNTQVSPFSQSAADRTDNNYNANVSFKYRIRTWLDASLGYRYMKKDSNDVFQSFTDNQVMLSIGASY